MVYVPNKDITVGPQAFYSLKSGSKIYARNKGAFIAGTNYDSSITTLFGLYKILFLGRDGDIIETQWHAELEELDTPTVPDEQKKYTSGSYTYEFTGWSPTLQYTVTQEQTYTAVYTQQISQQYKVGFYNACDNSTISVESYYADEEIWEPNTMGLTAPPYEDGYDGKWKGYRFSHWSTEQTWKDGADDFEPKCAGNAKYYAQFVLDYVEYTVTFRYGVDAEVERTCHYNDTLQPPTEGLNYEDDTYLYTFAGWEIVRTHENMGQLVDAKCTGSVTYQALYEKTYKEYTITFQDWNGNVIEAGDGQENPAICHYGDKVTPIYPAVEEMETVDKSWGGWKTVTGPDFDGTCKGDAVYQAIASTEPHMYTVVFYYDGGSSTKLYAWDTAAEDIEAPTLAETANRVIEGTDTVYATTTFTGWKDLATDVNGVQKVTRNAEYQAQYELEYVDFTITLLDENGNQIFQKTDCHHVEEGGAVIADYEGFPEIEERKTAGDGTVYVFRGWADATDGIVDLTTTLCQGDATYQAKYTAYYTVTFDEGYDGADPRVRQGEEGTLIVTADMPLTEPKRPDDEACTYTFKEWVDKDNAPVDLTTATYQANATYTAVYEAKQITVTAAATADGGSVSVDDGKTAEPGDEVVIKVRPDEGYVVGDVTITYTDENGKEKIIPAVPILDENGDPAVDEDGSCLYTYIQPDDVAGKVTVDVTFNKTFSPVIPETEGGTVTTDPAKPVAGQNVTIQAEPADEDHIVGQVTITYTDEYGETVTIMLEPNGDGEYVYVQPEADVTIEVMFVTVTDDPGNGGGSASGGSSSGGGPSSGGGGSSGGGSVSVDDGKTAEPGDEKVRPDDIQTSDWFYDDVVTACEAGYIEALTDTTFGPGEPFIRAQAAFALARLTGAETAGIEVTAAFQDIEPATVYAEEITWANKAGAMIGCGNGRFAPTGAVTREQLALMLYRLYGGGESAEWDAERFSDADEVSGWALDGVRWAVSVGLLSGMDDGRLEPQGIVTRAMAAAVLMRAHTLR